MEKGVKQDIMAEILGGTQEPKGIQDEDLEKIIYRDPKELKKAVHRAFRLTDVSAPTVSKGLKELIESNPEDELAEHKSFHLTPLTKKKTTIYFSKKIHRMLKSAKYKMKKMVEPELQNSISMSAIINSALVIVLHEFDVKGQDSILLKQMVKKINKKK